MPLEHRMSGLYLRYMFLQTSILYINKNYNYSYYFTFSKPSSEIHIRGADTQKCNRSNYLCAKINYNLHTYMREYFYQDQRYQLFNIKFIKTIHNS